MSGWSSPLSPCVMFLEDFECLGLRDGTVVKQPRYRRDADVMQGVDSGDLLILVCESVRESVDKFGMRCLGEVFGFVFGR